MNKKDAAAYLGISTRALEYHVTKGHIGSRPVPGKTGDVADFDAEELRRLKVELDEKRAPRPAVVSRESPEAEARSLARLSDAPPALLDLLARIAAGMEQPRRLSGGEGERAPTPAELEGKLILNLREVSAVTGRSVDRLREDCQSGRLKAKKNEIARGWMVKRADLDVYVRKL